MSVSEGFRSRLVGGLAVWAAALAPTAAAGPGPPAPAASLEGRFVFGGTAFRHDSLILDAAVSPDGTWLAVPGFGAVLVLDARTGDRRHALPADGLGSHAGGDRGLRAAFSPDGRLLAVGPDHGPLARVWDAATGKEVAALGPGPGLPARADMGGPGRVWFTPAGRLVAAWPAWPRGRRTALAVWDVRTKARVGLTDLAGPVVGRRPDGAAFATLEPAAGADKETGRDLVLWAFDGAGPVAARRIPVGAAEGGAVHAAFALDGKAVALALGDDLTVYDAGTGRAAGRVRAPAADRGPAFLFPTFAPDGKRLYAVDRDNRVCGFDLPGLEARPPLAGHLADVTALAVGPDGRLVYTAGKDNAVRRWDARAWKEVPLPPGYVGYRLLAAGGPVVAVGDTAGRVDVWDGRGLKVVRTLCEAGPKVEAVGVAGDGRTVAAGLADGTVRVWDARTGESAGSVRLPAGPDRDRVQAVRPLAGGLVLVRARDRAAAHDPRTGRAAWASPLAEVYAAGVSPDGRRVALLHADPGRGPGLVFLDARTGREMFAGTGAGPPELNSLLATAFSAVAFSPDGRVAVTHAGGPVLRVWDAADGACVREVKVGDWVRWSGFSPDGRWLLTAGAADDVGVWEVASGSRVARYADLPGEAARVAAHAPAALADLLAARRPGPSTDRPDELWAGLAAADAGRAYAAAATLAGRPAEAVALLRGRVAPARVPADRVARLVAGLGAERYADREAAVKELVGLGEAALPAIRAALAAPPSAEVEARARRVRDALRGPPPPDVLRQVRAVQVLEWAGTADARRLLAEWAAGSPGSRLTEEAKAALGRLGPG